MLNMEEKVKESIYKNLNIPPNTIILPKWGTKQQVSFKDFIDALFIYETGLKTINSLGRSEQTFNRLVKKLFPNTILRGGGETWLHWLISKTKYKKCYNCNIFHLKSKFSVYTNSSDGLDYLCISCKSEKNRNNYIKNKAYHQNYWKIHGKEKSARRRAKLIMATPKWANLEKIKEIYLNCPKDYQVDHIIPLRGKNVCGLHTEENLQYLTKEENLKKSNKEGFSERPRTLS